jgi:hypothetical protein
VKLPGTRQELRVALSSSFNLTSLLPASGHPAAPHPARPQFRVRANHTKHLLLPLTPMKILLFALGMGVIAQSSLEHFLTLELLLS